MANKKISELQSRTPALSDLMLVGDPSSGYSYKCTVTALATIIETDIADGYVTIGTTQTISGAKTFSNNLTLTSVVNTPTDPDKFLTLNASNVVTYRTGAEVLSDIGGVGGSGTTNYLPKFSATTTLANSQIFDNGTNVGIGVGSSIIAGYLLTIGGKVKIYNQIDLDNPTTNTCNAINIQKGTSISHRGVGYIQIASFNTNRLSLFFNDNNNYQADFDGSNLTTGQRYILPNATGTLALTSDLSSYVPTSRTLTINGTSYDLSANRTWSVGTVTSVAALTLGTTGTDLSSSVANGTTTPVITLNIPTASATNRGALSSTDWSTFNNKQSTITLTTTGSSGSATFVSNTLNVPTYTLAGLGGISGSGTTNYIPKFTSSSAIGNSVIYESGGSIGINETTPSEGKLVINNPNGSTNNGVSGNSLYLKAQTANSNLIRFSGAVATDMIFGRFGNQDNFGWGTTGGSEYMRLTSTGLGIGTSSPIEKLTTNGLIATTGASVTSYYVGNNNAGFIDYNSGDTRIGSQSSAGSSRITFYTTSSGYTGITERMRLDASGNLGLGVTPSAWDGYTGFQIGTQGAIGATSTVINVAQNVYYGSGGNSYIANGKAAMYQMNDGEHNWRIAPSGTAGNAISFTQAMTLDANNNLYLGGTTNPYSVARMVIEHTSTYNRSMFKRGTDFIEITPTGYDGTVNLIASNFATGGYYKPLALSGRQTASDLYLATNGNVGIGTTSPTNKLQSYGGTLTVNDEGTYSARFSNGSTKGVVIGYDNTNNKGHISSVNPAVSWTDLILNANGGNVGIGTSSPASLLHLNVSSGSIFSQITSGANQTYLGFDAGSGLTTLQSNNSIYFGTGASAAERMRITSGGNVGIGTSAPSVNLQVQSASAPEMRITDGTIGYQMYAQTGSNDMVLGTYTNHNLLFRTNAQARMLLSAAGELLINTTSDAGDYKLQVNGAIYGTYDITLNSYPGYGSGSSNFYYNGTDSRFVFNANLKANSGEFSGSIKTAAPSGGTAKPWKFGEAGVSVGGANTTAVKVEIDGVVYYLLTAYLPEPAPESAPKPKPEG